MYTSFSVLDIEAADGRRSSGGDKVRFSVGPSAAAVQYPILENIKKYNALR